MLIELNWNFVSKSLCNAWKKMSARKEGIVFYTMQVCCIYKSCCIENFWKDLSFVKYLVSHKLESFICTYPMKVVVEGNSHIFTFYYILTWSSELSCAWMLTLQYGTMVKDLQRNLFVRKIIPEEKFFKLVLILWITAEQWEHLRAPSLSLTI